MHGFNKGARIFGLSVGFLVALSILSSTAAGSATKLEASPRISGDHATSGRPSTLDDRATRILERFEEWIVLCKYVGLRKSCEVHRHIRNRKTGALIATVYFREETMGRGQAMIALPPYSNPDITVRLSSDGRAISNPGRVRRCTTSACYVQFDLSARHLAYLKSANTLAIRISNDHRSAAISISIESLRRVLARAMTLLNEIPPR